MKQPNCSRGLLLKLLGCVSLLGLVTWNGHNSLQMSRIVSEREASVKRMETLIGQKDNILKRLERQIKAVEKNFAVHKLAKRSIPRPQINGSGRGGATYTRWGRRSCGSESQLVYEGHAGGSWFEHTGGAVNYVCLPKLPLWNKDGACGARIYGAEYQETNQFLTHNSNGKLLDQNVPCAVCRSAERASQIMIPARNVCYESWTLEYQGYLMTGHYGHKNNYEYVCMDEAPEADPAGYRDENGAMFYSVSAGCGSLPCPDYISGKKLTCAVCTK